MRSPPLTRRRPLGSPGDARELVRAHEPLLLLLATLRAAGVQSLRTLYFSKLPGAPGRTEAHGALASLVAHGVLARQEMLLARSIYRLGARALKYSPRVRSRVSDVVRRPLPETQAAYCWLRAAVWAELARRGYHVGRGPEELAALRRFLVDMQRMALEHAAPSDRSAAARVLEALRSLATLTPLFRTRCTSCTWAGPLNRPASGCPRCHGAVTHALSERRFRCLRCATVSDVPGPHSPTGASATRCDGAMREIDHLAFDVAWRRRGQNQDVLLVLVDDPGRSLGVQLRALPLRIGGQPRVPILLRTTDPDSSFDRVSGTWITQGERHRALLRAFAAAGDRRAFPYAMTTTVVELCPELQLRFSRTKGQPHD